MKTSTRSMKMKNLCQYYPLLYQGGRKTRGCAKKKLLTSNT